MERRIATIIATNRLRRQMLMTRLIIEQHSSLDNDAVAGIQPLVDTCAIALSITREHRAPDESPWRNLDEYYSAVVIHEEGGIRHKHRGFLRYIEACVGKHIGFELAGRIGESYPHFVATRVRFYHSAYECDSTAKNLFRVGCEGHVDELALGNVGDVDLRHVRRDPNRIQICNHHERCG